MANDSEVYLYDANLIRKQLELSADIQNVARRMDNLESQIQVLVKGQEYMIRSLNKMEQTRRRSQTVKPPRERRKLQKFSKEPTAADMSKLLHLPQALQKNINKFTDQMLVKCTSIPDDLLAECLSENECEAILSKPSPKDQARMLIRKIKNRGPQKIAKFLEIVGQFHPELPQEVYATQERLAMEHKNKPLCVICVMKTTVDLRDIGDNLWSEDIISDDVHGDIFDSVNSNKHIYWDSIINSIHSFEDSDAAVNILKDALAVKYKHIVEYLNKTPDRSSLSCCCCKPRRAKRRTNSSSDFGSQTEYSTTSSTLPRLPTVLYDRDDVSSVASQGSTSLPSDTLSFDELGFYENIDPKVIQDAQISSSTDDKLSDKTRHSSGNFIPTSNYQEDCGDINLSVPLAEHVQNLQSAHTQKSDIYRSIRHNSSVTICAGHSTSSGDISPNSPSKPSDKSPLSSDLSPTTTSETTITKALMTPVNREEESAKETDDDDEDAIRQKNSRKQKKSRHLQTKSFTASDSEMSLQRDSRVHTPWKPYKVVKTKARPVSTCSTTNVGVRRQGSRKSKSSQKRALRRQQSRDMNLDFAMTKDRLRDSEHGLKKPFNPLWRKGDLYNKAFLQPLLVPRWDYLQAKRYNRMAHMTSKRTRVVEDDSDFVTEDSETLTNNTI